MSAAASEQKAALRRRLRAELKEVSAAERAAASAHIRELIKAQSVWRDARAVLFFFPTPQEPDAWPLALEALALGKAVCLPRYVASRADYEARRIRDPDRDLAPGQFGILEPVAACPKFSANKLDLALVPGVGFSLIGGRLGRGQGFYDRLLARVSGVKCGVAYEFQAAIEVPLEPHDIRLNGIVTPSRWHWVARQARS